MRQRANPWIASLAGLAALALTAPTAAFIIVNMFPRQLEWLSGVRMPLAVSTAPGLEWLVPALPMLALIVALAPAVRMRLNRDADGSAVVSVRMVSIPRPLVIIIAACAVLAGGVVAYGVSENLLEALR